MRKLLHAGHRPLRRSALRIEQKECCDEPPSWYEHTMALLKVVAHFGELEMGEHGEGHDAIEVRVAILKNEPRRSAATRRIVAVSKRNVREMKVRMLTCDVACAP